MRSHWANYREFCKCRTAAGSAYEIWNISVSGRAEDARKRVTRVSCVLCLLRGKRADIRSLCIRSPSYVICVGPTSAGDSRTDRWGRWNARATNRVWSQAGAPGPNRYDGLRGRRMSKTTVARPPEFACPLPVPRCTHSAAPATPVPRSGRSFSNSPKISEFCAFVCRNTSRRTRCIINSVPIDFLAIKINKGYGEEFPSVRSRCAHTYLLTTLSISISVAVFNNYCLC